MKVLEVGTPLWAGGFGCVTWIGAHEVGAVFLDNGEPKIVTRLPHSGACRLADEFETRWRASRPVVQ